MENEDNKEVRETTQPEREPIAPGTRPEPVLTIDSVKPAKKQLKERIVAFFKNPKKRLAFIAGTGVVIIALVGYGLFSLNAGDINTLLTGAEKKQEEEKAPTVPAILNGVMTDQESANRHPLAIVVENHVDARPQAGLDKADIVYETVAEGGITRFLALFGSQEAEKVGPVRSARTYFVDWAHGFNAFLAHVGGNMDALDQIKAEKTLDLDQFTHSGPYWRENRGNLAVEHTMYTSTVKLRKEAADSKYSNANNFTVYKFKDDAAEAERPATQTISIDFSNASYNVRYEYDKTTNSYKRFLAGSEHTDQVSKNQITSKNLVVMTVNRKATVTRINEQGWDMSNVGNGSATIFMDGKTIKGTWKKTSKSDREVFYDETGKEIVFNRGQFWLAAIAPGDSLTVK